ncbi:hypothetical protein Q9295_10165 [Xinfangfangia sp. CPCC 101601]|uniref:Uncharacterized protein n=1 Tax=Pseudogemmobacter lacusdianii TaxID=3069608 RepID=A0ABU0VYB4_9RHOB|nr:hypothetical protein [Xinfangfangia sp. CPCC 101601]MDQ2066742.1 hypothetical protein [Xinfangfangia sp. CPCC 101601]
MDYPREAPTDGERTIQLTKEKALRVGAGLRNLMKDEGFETAVQVLKDEYQTVLFSTLPHETDKRQLLYLEARCLDNLLATLRSFVAHADHEAMKSLVYSDEDEPIIV